MTDTVTFCRWLLDGPAEKTSSLSLLILICMYFSFQGCGPACGKCDCSGVKGAKVRFIVISLFCLINNIECFKAKSDKFDHSRKFVLLNAKVGLNSGQQMEIKKWILCGFFFFFAL